MPLRQPTAVLVSSFRGKRGTTAYPHVVELNKTFVAPLARGDSLDVAKLLEFATNFIVIDELAGGGVPQRYDQSTLGNSVGWNIKEDINGLLHLISVTIRSLVVVSRERVMHVDLGRAQHTMRGVRAAKYLLGDHLSLTLANAPEPSRPLEYRAEKQG